jgi:hypothetical protein
VPVPLLGEAINTDVNNRRVKMFNDLLKMYRFPMFDIVGDEDSGGTTVEDENKPPVEDDSQPPTPPAEKEEVIDESEISDDDYNATMEKMSPRQLAAMNNRMRAKMAKLEGERKAPPEPIKKEEPAKPENPQEQVDFDPVKWVSDTDKGKAAIAHLQRSGLDSDQIRAIIDLMGITGTRITKWGIDPIASEFREGKFSKALDTFSNDDKYKFGMSKPEIKKEVESYIRNNYQPEEWNKPETIKAAYGLTLAEHPEIFASQGKREIVEDGDIHGKPQGGAVDNSSSLAAFAKQHGMDYDTNENKSIVRAAYAAFKSVEKKKEKN